MNVTEPKVSQVTKQKDALRKSKKSNCKQTVELLPHAYRVALISNEAVGCCGEKMMTQMTGASEETPFKNVFERDIRTLTKMELRRKYRAEATSQTPFGRPA